MQDDARLKAGSRYLKRQDSERREQQRGRSIPQYVNRDRPAPGDWDTE